MDSNPNTQVDLYLTEISIELLGNKIYDINGKRQHKLSELFKAVPGHHQKEEKEENDLMCVLGYENDYAENCESLTHFMEDQMDYILVDANVSEDVNKSIISFLRKYKSDQDRLLKEVSELHVKKLVGKKSLIILMVMMLILFILEQRKITVNLNRARQLAVNAASTHEEKSEQKIKNFLHFPKFYCFS